MALCGSGGKLDRAVCRKSTRTGTETGATGSHPSARSQGLPECAERSARHRSLAHRQRGESGRLPHDLLQARFARQAELFLRARAKSGEDARRPGAGKAGAWRDRHRRPSEGPAGLEALARFRPRHARIFLRPRARTAAPTIFNKCWNKPMRRPSTPVSRAMPMSDDELVREIARTWNYHCADFTLAEENDRFVFRLDPCGSGGPALSRRYVARHVQYGEPLSPIMREPHRHQFQPRRRPPIARIARRRTRRNFAGSLSPTRRCSS